MNHKPRCNCEDCAAADAAYLGYVEEYAKALEVGLLKLYQLCSKGEQSDGAAAWELLKTLAELAEANNLGAQLAAMDLDLDVRAAAETRRANRLH